MNKKTEQKGRGRIYLLLLPLFFAVSCSDSTLSLFFDIPPPTEQEKAAAARKKEAAAATQPQPAPESIVVEEEKRPEIEALLDWEQVAEKLPKDDMDEVDWSAAIREGIISPRAEIGRQGDPEARIFKFDFFFAGPDPDSDAYFPHSAHTAWLTCESCHPAIFPYRETGMQIGEKYAILMDQIFEGEYCGKCHGIVAFSLDSCNRCHLNM